MRGLYDLAFIKPWSYILKYPVAALFLIDFHLTWRFTEKELRGDVATNISSGLARMLTPVGFLIRLILRK